MKGATDEPCAKIIRIASKIRIIIIGIIHQSLSFQKKASNSPTIENRVRNFLSTVFS